MKKLFISCPMRGRTAENIRETMRKMHKIAELYVGEDLEVINTFIDDPAYKSTPLEFIGESIKRMQEADYFVGIRDHRLNRWCGCCIERDAFSYYKDYKNMIQLDGEMLMPDTYEPLDDMPVCTR